MPGRALDRSVPLLLPVFLIACASLATPRVARALAEAPASTFQNPLHAGMHAFEFQLGGNFTIGALQGATLSYKKMCTDRSAWRVGLTLDVSFSDARRSSAYESLDSSLSPIAPPASTSDDDSQRYTLSWQYVRYAGAGARTHMFFETGPSVTYGRNRTVSGNVSAGTGETLATTWRLGWSGDVGVEWFASRHISLHSQYGLELSYSRASQVMTNRDSYAVATQHQVSHTYGMRPTRVTTGVSVYF